jgi:hypothetical protein
MSTRARRGYRIMHEHGALPEEITLRKAVEAAKAEYAKAGTPEEKRAAMARIAELQMKLSIASEARKKFMIRSVGLADAACLPASRDCTP